MFLLGTELFLAFWMASKRVGLPEMSAPPARAATSMFLISFAKSLPRLASITAFLCFVVAHLEWPDIRQSPSRHPLLLFFVACSSSRNDPTGIRSPRGAHGGHEEFVHPVVAGQLRVEGRRHDVALPDGDDVAAVLGEHPDLGAHRLDPGRPDEDALHRPALDARHLDGRLEGLVLPPEG